jgi:hypothetical protein
VASLAGATLAGAGEAVVLARAGPSALDGGAREAYRLVHAVVRQQALDPTLDDDDHPSGVPWDAGDVLAEMTAFRLRCHDRDAAATSTVPAAAAYLWEAHVDQGTRRPLDAARTA